MYQDIVDQFYVGQPIYYCHPRSLDEIDGFKHYGYIVKVEPFLRGKRLHIKFENIDDPLLYTVTYETCMIWPRDGVLQEAEWEV